MSTRARLTTYIAVVLMGSMLLFGVALWVERRAAATEALTAEVQREGDDVLDLLREAQLEGKVLTMRDSVNVSTPTVHPTQDLTKVLDPVAGYFMVLDNKDRTLYASALVRMLSSDDQADLLRQAALTSAAQEPIVPVSVPSGDSVRATSLLMVSRTGPAVDPNISRVIAALPTDVAELPANLLIGTMFALAPVVLLIALVVAYLIAGGAFRPVDELINEVAAITDGRSLHRRLPADTSNDELSRLGVTVNAMLARLEDSFGALRRFTADASHELKTPLTVLRANIERASHPDTSRGDRMIALEEALQETARMADLVDSLLTLARADEGRFDLHRTPVDLEPLVREVLETAVILGEDAGLHINVPVLENVVVMGDRARLRQLLLNLVTNAIKYTPRGGRVDLSVSKRPQDEVAISVRDSGIGISAHDIPHVFERFWRADRARSRASERGGFGLGLSIAQWIAQAHDGSLSVQSRLGRGSIFTVVLPTVPTTEDVVAELQEAPVAGQSLTNS